MQARTDSAQGRDDLERQCIELKHGLYSASMRFHHGLYEVHLPVTDLDRAIDFYVEKLGFELGFGERGGPSALLLFADGDARWMLGLFQVDVVAHRHPAEYHISFRVPISERVAGPRRERIARASHVTIASVALVAQRLLPAMKQTPPTRGVAAYRAPVRRQPARMEDLETVW